MNRLFLITLFFVSSLAVAECPPGTAQVVSISSFDPFAVAIVAQPTCVAIAAHQQTTYVGIVRQPVERFVSPTNLYGDRDHDKVFAEQYFLRQRPARKPTLNYGSLFEICQRYVDLELNAACLSQAIAAAQRAPVPAPTRPTFRLPASSAFMDGTGE